MFSGMKRDMGGAAAVLGAFHTLVTAKFRQNLHACLCIVENNISPRATKPDDIVTMLSGKTVEISNTDAEGRLILADGVCYAKNILKADVIIDLATLTGTQSYVSGKFHAALLTNCQEWERKACVAGRRSGDLVAPMIFCPDLHFPDLRSPVADMRNSNLGKTEGPPSALAGLFIGAHIDFGDGLKWLHFDMAASAEIGDRGTGYGVALLSYLLGHLTMTPMFQRENGN
ncbi:Leucine aminopeptidase 1 [Parelaphostrongylus tenuis]|uniref:Leucine aminopeptidase 1 n=1 Tax=Parelaphostrongylus tenuis TaxID=148309 RepID=A0AAD5MLL7_PARTN|nr:Leucine aminopeptidase 1 [Parelaphostrongylus tenuis]